MKTSQCEKQKNEQYCLVLSTKARDHEFNTARPPLLRVQSYLHHQDSNYIPSLCPGQQ